MQFRHLHAAFLDIKDLSRGLQGQYEENEEDASVSLAHWIPRLQGYEGSFHAKGASASSGRTKRGNRHCRGRLIQHPFDELNGSPYPIRLLDFGFNFLRTLPILRLIEHFVE
jgi:hypothetical protein